MTSSKEGEVANEAGSNYPLYRWEGRNLGISFENLCVYADTGSQTQVDDLVTILGRIAQWPFTFAKQNICRSPPQTQAILQGLTGVLNPGETLLVLGSPGAGCTTTLKAFASFFETYSSVTGEMTYGGITPQQITQQYRSEVIYTGEEDIHFPKLKVKDTLDFALRLRKPFRAGAQTPDKQFSSTMSDRLLNMLGIAHTSDTIVGNSLVRGVSGGERKRMSLAEALTVNPSVACWDNPIRGLDSSSALEFLANLKQMSKANGMTNIVSLYQASEAMYQTCFDKVLVLYTGRVIYFGPVSQAKAYFNALGFQSIHRQTTPEFLTAITSPQERRIDPSYTGPLYLTPDALAKRFEQSENFSQVCEEITRYKAGHCQGSCVNEFQQAVDATVSKFRVLHTIEPLTILTQVSVTLTRFTRLLWSDRVTFFTAICLAIVNAVICGSGFSAAPRTSTGSFERSCALYFPLVYFFLNALTEVNKTVEARNILLKQHKLGLIHPSSFVITQAIGDIPSSLIQTLLFSCCYYFIVGLSKTASQFWIFVLITFTHYSSVSAMFRMIGAWAPSLSVALLMMGSAIPISTLYAGYAPPFPTQHRWGSWMRRVAPTPYALEALIRNEFYNIQLHCTDNELVPSGPGYTDLQYQGCPLPGAEPGERTAPGSDYIDTLYNYTHDHLWRNFGIILVMWFLYTVLSVIGLTVMTRETGHSSGYVFKAGASKAPKVQGTTDTLPENETQTPRPVKARANDDDSAHESSSTLTNESKPEQQCDHSKKNEESRLFTFEDITYTVNTPGGPKKLLNHISGYVKAGQLTALMGASGAGKTTLLDTLSQRKREGQIDGTMLMNGKPITRSFMHSCGFCMQQDIHEPFTTIREALQFSAYLRQPAEVPYAEKMEYVEHIIRLLELDSLADAIIGEADDGKLNVEERKRVTIGVELAARPTHLLFLDEPTSGLDSQAAYSIVSFLQRIAAEGIPIVCTIRQPSGVIFEMFDHVLLLAPGGNTVYFGETGRNSKHLVDYFARYGSFMNEDDNPAEYILSTVTTQRLDTRDWVKTWCESPEAAALKARIKSLKDGVTANPDHSSAAHRAYAQPFAKQVYAVTSRHWTTIWRHGQYNFSRLFKCIFYELIISFTFFHEGTDLQSLQNRMLGILLATWIIPVNAADMQAVWFDRWSVFEGRERNGIYDYKALLIALVTVEIPWNFALYTLVDVVCKERDYARFIPPNGQTCGEYTSRFLESNPGYLVDANATEICFYCKYNVGDDYLQSLDFAYSDRWRDWAVFLGFCITNIVLVFFSTWFLRIKMQQLKHRFGR
ncbi:ABC drug exporter [Penicillium brevicompactum]|uniref:ABC drug exporter n=1 Tax=Penicillium brevicompactum TaxID=5074 RepID=A0A9W9Q2W8_PENBR|nr:ABC drug exporter [Penicillium brevicompactum]